MPDRDYLADAPGFFGAKVSEGRLRDGPAIIYMDGRTRALPENIAEARKRRWLETTPGDFQQLDDGLYVDRAGQSLYEQAGGSPLLGDSGDITVFIVRPDPDGGEIIFLRPVAGTLQEHRQETARAAAEQDQVDAAAAETRAKRLDRQPKQAVTLGDMLGRDLPTLQQAARVIVEEFRGRIDVRDGRLVVSVPELLTEPGSWNAPAAEETARGRVNAAARVLVAGRQVVLQELGRRGGLDPGRLPDVQVGADGTVA